jgi:predicted metal-dependent HD superfamily phosphohydrolase
MLYNNKWDFEPYTTFEHLMSKVNASHVDVKALKNRVTDKPRLYHNAYHLSHMWHLYTTIIAENRDSLPDYLRNSYFCIANAIAYHDAIYVAGNQFNELSSADTWYQDALVDDTFTREHRSWVYEAIYATADHLDPNMLIKTDYDRLTHFFLGLDLAALAAPWATFVLNNKLIRLEYTLTSDEDFERGNRDFMFNLLGAEKIFRDPILHSLFEEPARLNIKKRLGIYDGT